MRLRKVAAAVLWTLFILVISSLSCVQAESISNPAYEYYFRQLDANQQAMYRVMLMAPAETAEYSLTLPEDGISEGNVSAKLQTTIETLKMDHPEVMAWLSWFENLHYDRNSNTVAFTLRCDDFYDPDDQLLSEKLLDAIAAEADPAWDLYTKARFASNVVIDALSYDSCYVFYSENGKANYYNSNIYCVNNGYGICGGFSKLYKAIADRIGLPCVEVGSVGHAWVHVKMEDGNWYGIDPQDPYILQGTESMLNSYFMGDVDMYVLYDGFFGEGSSIRQPERTENDYVYVGQPVEPGSVDLTQLRRDLFATETIFEYSINADGVSCTITGFSGKETGDLVIPSIIDGYTVTAIGNSAFVYAAFDGTLMLPDTIEIIESQAFAGCDRLTGQLILPADLVTIRSAAFIRCSGLTGELVFNEKLERIGRGAFAFCEGLTGSLMLPDSIVELEKDAIYQCSGLNGVLHIPTGMHDWSASYVTLCDNLSGFDISLDHPNYCVVDGILYSKDMTQLIQCMIAKAGSLVIPEGVTTIGRQALYRCERITSISFPSTLKRIEDWGCAGMLGVTDPLVLPEGLEYLGNNAFQQIGMQGTLVIPSGVQLGESVFEVSLGITTVIVEEGVTELPADTFYFCTGLAAVYLPSTINSIGNNCFFCVYDVKIFGTPGTAAEDFVNSEDGLELRAEFYPLEFSGGYFLEGETYLSVLEADHSRTSQLQIMPAAPESKVIWSSSDESVATVTDGLVTGVMPGQAVITASFDHVSIHCTVTVHNGIKISADGKRLLKVSEHFSGELVIPDGVEFIDGEAVFCVEGITGIYFPDTLKTLASNCLYGLGYANDLHFSLPDSVTSVAAGAVENNRFIELYYPAKAKVENNAFSLCHIMALNIPEGVSNLPPKVFQNADIGRCYLPESLTHAPYSVFAEARVETFYGYSGTYAEQYVTELQAIYPEMNYVFVALDTVELAGDANVDGTVDIYDALIVLKYDAGWAVPIHDVNADYNADGVVDASDALGILIYCANGDLTSATRALRAMQNGLTINIVQIVEQPVNQSAEVGKQAQFAVSATGDGLTYQWYVNCNDGNGWCPLNRVTGAAYLTSPVKLDNDGNQYRCVIKDAYGHEVASDAAVLHVALTLPITGDASDPLLYALAMLVSGAVLLCVCSKKCAWQ